MNEITPPTFLEALKNAFAERFTFEERDDGFHIVIEKSPDSAAFFRYFIRHGLGVG